jgi:hypothetical protein
MTASDGLLDALHDLTQELTTCHGWSHSDREHIYRTVPAVRAICAILSNRHRYDETPAGWDRLLTHACWAYGTDVALVLIAIGDHDLDDPGQVDCVTEDVDLIEAVLQ